MTGKRDTSLCRGLGGLEDVRRGGVGDTESALRYARQMIQLKSYQVRRVHNRVRAYVAALLRALPVVVVTLTVAVHRW